MILDTKYCILNTEMSRRPELNRQPMVYDTIALPIELRRRSDLVRLWRKLSHVGNKGIIANK